MCEKSLIDYGYEVLSASKEPIRFLDLFAKVIELSGLELSENEQKVRMSKFYTQLSLDERFITLTDNFWDLRSRHVFEQVHLDMIDAYSDDEEDEVDEEEKEYLRQELGEQEEEVEEESDDLDFDKPVKDDDEDEVF